MLNLAAKDKLCLLYHSDNLFESVRLGLGQERQRLAIQRDILLFCGTHEFAVGKAERTEGGIDLHIPEPAKVAFLVAAMGEGISAGMGESFVGGALIGGTSKTEAFGLAEDFPAVFERVDCFFYSGHGIGL